LEINKKDIADYLDKYGLKHSLIGFDYLVTAIIFGLENNELKYHTCDLYNAVAKFYDINTSRIERSIRNSILVAKINESSGEFLAKAIDSFYYSNQNINVVI
jgi:hypothetical protein